MIKTVGLVSVAHFYSHFYLLLLPPLFPLLKNVYGVSYTELGLSITLFSVVTGLTQAPMGFLVDRYGPARILTIGLGLQSVAFLGVAVLPSYSALLGLMAVAGLSNAVYHPADYAILNATADDERMGRVFSIHTGAGYLGAAVAPVVVLSLVTVVSWQLAVALCAVSGGVVAVVLGRNQEALAARPLRAIIPGENHPGENQKGNTARRDQASPEEGTTTGLSGWALLLSRPIVLGLLFFTGLSMISHGFTDFGVSAIKLMHDIPLAQAGVALSAYLFAAPCGVLIGGWVADRVPGHAQVVATCLGLHGLIAFTIAGVQPVGVALLVLLACAGFFNGLVAPSRDLIIRAVTPPAETGKVFGFVSTGYNLGGVVGPALYGSILDHASANMLFVMVGGLSLITVATVLITGKAQRISRDALAS